MPAPAVAAERTVYWVRWREKRREGKIAKNFYIGNRGDYASLQKD